MTATVAVPGSWTRRILAVAVLVAPASAVPGHLLLAAAAALGAAVAVMMAATRLVRCWPGLAAGVLPAAERPQWQAEVRAVLHAAGDGRERRRQVRGFLLGLPACAVTSWRLALRRT